MWIVCSAQCSGSMRIRCGCAASARPDGSSVKMCCGQEMVNVPDETPDRTDQSNVPQSTALNVSGNVLPVSTWTMVMVWPSSGWSYSFRSSISMRYVSNGQRECVASDA